MGGLIARPPRCSRPSAIIAVALAVAVTGCGGGGDASHARSTTKAKPRTSAPSRGRTLPKRRLFKADPKNVAIVRAWVDQLRAGRIAAASRYFAIPVLVQNASPPYRLATREAVRAFNESLPCGARFVRAVAGDKYTIVTFRLTERRGSKQGCGTGTGNLAATAFRFRHGKISEWIRVTIPPANAGEDEGAPI